MPQPSELTADCSIALDVIEELTTRASIERRSYTDDDGDVAEVDYRPPCKYTDVVAALGSNHTRAQAALRTLEEDGSIVWLGSGVLFPNRFPWSQFARRAGHSIVTDATGPAR